MGAYRNVALTELPLRGISVNPTGGSATINVVASDSGVMFVNKYVTGDTTYNLPAVADASGKMFWFFQAQNTKNVVINAPANTMFMTNDLAATSATNTTTPAVGDVAFVICDGTSYYFWGMSGDWTNA